MSKGGADYNEQDPFAAMERKGIVTTETLPDVIEQGRKMMTPTPFDVLVEEMKRKTRHLAVSKELGMATYYETDIDYVIKITAHAVREATLKEVEAGLEPQKQPWETWDECRIFVLSLLATLSTKDTPTT